MKTKFFAPILLAQFLFCQFVFGQERGWVNVPVKQNNGRKQEEILYRNSYALLIGNSEYAEWNSLPGVERDVPQIEAVLRDKHGFTVEKALNLSKKELLNRIDEFISNYGQDYENRLLVYYAGHGYTAVLPDKRVMGYLVMKDAPVVPPVEESLQKTPKNFGDFRLRAISMDDIEKSAKEITTRHALFVFDSCFSGTALYRDNAITVPQEISTEELEQMRGFLTAGNEKQRVRDDSPFRRAFIKGLEGKADTNSDGFILSSELGAYVKREVYLETRNTDTPQSPIFGKQTNFTRGDMVFLTLKNESKSNQTPIPAKSSEEVFWQAIESSDQISDFESYLSKCRNGEFNCLYGSTAELKLYRLKKANSPLIWTNLKTTAKKLLKYDWVYPGDEGLDLVHKNYNYGFVDKNGNEVVPPKYDTASFFSGGMAVVSLNKKFGFIDKTGKEVVALYYDYATSFSEGLAGLKLNGRIGFIDKSRNLVIPFRFEYDHSTPFSRGLALLSSNGKSVVIDKTGKEVKNQYMYNFSEGLAAIRNIFGKCGFINESKEIIITPKYDECESFSEELAAVRLNGKWGFINKAGKEVIAVNLDYTYPSEFEDGLSMVQSDGKTSFIDKTGKEVISARKYRVWCISFRKEGFIGVFSNGRKGFVDIYGNEYFDF